MPNPSESLTVLTTKEVAAMLKVSTRTVLEMVKRGLPAQKVGRAWRFNPEAIKAWLDARTEDERRPPQPKQEG